MPPVVLGDTYGVTLVNGVATNRAAGVFVHPPFPVDLIRFNEILTLPPRWYLQEVSLTQETAGSQLEVELSFVHKLESVARLSTFKLVERILL